MRFPGIPFDFELKSMQEIASTGCPLIAIPASGSNPFMYAVAGTKSGFRCSLCNQDCILAPSGQMQFAFGENPIVCVDCALELYTKKVS